MELPLSQGIFSHHSRVTHVPEHLLPQCPGLYTRGQGESRGTHRFAFGLGSINTGFCPQSGSRVRYDASGGGKCHVVAGFDV